MSAQIWFHSTVQTPKRLLSSLTVTSVKRFTEMGCETKSKRRRENTTHSVNPLTLLVDRLHSLSIISFFIRNGTSSNQKSGWKKNHHSGVLLIKHELSRIKFRFCIVS